MTQMTQTTDKAGTDGVSGLRYIERGWSASEATITIEAIEGDGVCMEINAVVHDVDGLDALIATLQARRADLVVARTLADS